MSYDAKHASIDGGGWAFIGDTALVLAVRGGGVLAQLGLFAMAAKTISLAAVGYFSVFTTVLFFARSLGPLGSDVVLMKYGRDRHTDPWLARPLAQGLLGRVLGATGLVGGIAAAAFGVAVTGSHDGNGLLCAIALLAGCVGVALNGVHVGVLRAEGAAGRAQLPESFLQPAVALTSYAVLPYLQLERTLAALLLCQMVGVAIALLIYRWWVHSRLGTADVTPAEVGAFRKSCWTVLGGLAATTIGSRCGSLFVLPIAGATSAGLYETGLKTQLVGTNATWAAGLAVGPRFARARRAGDRRTLERLLALSTAFTVVPSAAVVIALVFAGTPVLRLLGDQYTAAYSTAMLLALAALADASTGPIGYLYNMTGHERVVARSDAVQLAVTLVLLPVLTAVFGSPGAATAILVSVCVRNVLLAARLHRSLGIRPAVLAFAGGPGRALDSGPRSQQDTGATDPADCATEPPAR